MTTALAPSTPMTQREFGTIFAKLAMQLRATDVDEATIRSYFEALGGYPLEAVRMAAEAFSREPGRKWFPTSGEWSEGIQRAAAANLREAVSHRAEPWHLECERCEDTGWAIGMSCPGDSTCGRRNTHAAHTFTRACYCRPTNRTYQRHVSFGKGEA